VAALRLGLVGCGRIAERGYVPAAASANGVLLAAVADTEISRCERVAPRVRAYASAEELLEAGGVDALVVATTADSHLAVTQRAAAAGLPALVEKPPGVDAAEAAALAGLVPAPSVSFNRRFDPALARLRRSLPPEGFEVALSITYRRRLWAPYDMRDDALLDLGPHLVDLARWFGGEVVRIRTRALSERRADLELELERGRAHVVGATDRSYREIFEARVGGRLIGRHTAGGVAAAIRAFRRSCRSPLVTSLAAQLEAFAEVVRGGRSERLATAADGLAAMLVLDAARESARSGDPSWRAVPAPAA
jgi:myo-inositol 2-dehydrogenase/D-chiro-inositol 1-dehydrogenase